MTVRFAASGGGGGVPGGGGWGTAASRPFGVNGVIVMKITRRTRSTSINGVILMSPLVANFFFLPFIRYLLLSSLFVQLLRQQSDAVHARGPDCVDNLDDISIAGALVGLDIYRLVAFARLQQFGNLLRKIVNDDS